jgi:hypothetical protein
LADGEAYQITFVAAHGRNPIIYLIAATVDGLEPHGGDVRLTDG